MATYKKRGYKPKNKREQAQLDEMNSTTAEVFGTLDEGASKTEAWFTKNQNYILGVIVAVAVGILGYLAYGQFVQKPKEANAANELFFPQQYFDQAMADEAARDSLLNLALNGAEGKYGFLDIMEEYKGTKAANLAAYSAGMAYLNNQNYDEAITYLDQFNSKDAVLGALAKGGIGDAFAQLGQSEDALDYYKEAFAHSTNDFTTPKFLYKAGILAMNLGYQDQAIEYLTTIKNDFPKSKQATDIDVLIGSVKK